MPILLLVIVGLLVHSTAWCDSFGVAKGVIRKQVARQDSTGITVRGGATLETGVVPNTQTLLRGQATIGGGCSAFDFATSLKETFQELPDTFVAIAEQVLQNVPMLVACYTEPVVCDLLKHFQALSNIALQAKYGRCQQMQDAMAYIGKRWRGGHESQCLDEQVSLGLSINTAMRNCAEGGVPWIRSPFGDNRQQVNLVEEALGAAGASTEVQTLARSLLGEVRLSASSRGLGWDRERPHQRLFARYEAHRQEADDTLQIALQELRETGDVSEATLDRISVPGQAVPVAVLQSLLVVERDRVRYQALLQKVATGLAITRLTWECDELQETLTAAVDANIQMKPEEQRHLEKQLEDLRRDLQRVIAKKEVLEKHVQPAFTSVMEEAAAIQAYTSQVGMRAAPTTDPPPMPYRRQSPMGNSQ